MKHTIRVAILKAIRTEHAKLIRRLYGDNSGMNRFHDKVWSPRTDGLCNTISTVTKDNLLYMNASKEQILNELNNLQEDEYVRIRKFTPREVLRLMGVRDNRIDVMLNCGVSNSQIYKQAGNSIVVDNLMAIFENLLYPDGEKCKPCAGTQLTLW